MIEKVARKSVTTFSECVTRSFLSDANPLPLVISPVSSEIDLAEWAKANAKKLKEELTQYGAILFRGFNIDTNEKLKSASLAFVPELLPYVEKRSPRTTLGEGVYSSTIYPNEQYIHFHNTTSYSHQWPMKLWFCCFRPADEWGYTPIADCRKVTQNLSESTRAKFARFGVQYVKNFSDNVGLTWQETFSTEDKLEVERFCRENDIAFEWVNDEHLRTKQVRHAYAEHPITKDIIWFNQAHHYHVQSLDPNVRDSLLRTYTEENLPRHSYYGNGDVIELDVIDEITEAYKKEEVAFAWEKGDVLMLDNMLTAHSRTPYKGDRLIALTLGDMFVPHYAGGGVAFAQKQDKS